MTTICILRLILLALAAGIITSATIGIMLRRTYRRRLLLWVAFGVSDFVILAFGDPFSLYVLLAFKNSLVLTTLGLWAYDDIRLKGLPWTR